MESKTIDNAVFLFACRYALGRKSTAPEIVTRALKHSWDYFPSSMQDQIKREIKEAIDNDRAGMSIDVRTWQKILEL